MGWADALGAVAGGRCAGSSPRFGARTAGGDTKQIVVDKINALIERFGDVVDASVLAESEVEG